jgi:hypothetical protein
MLPWVPTALQHRARSSIARVPGRSGDVRLPHTLSRLRLSAMRRRKYPAGLSPARTRGSPFRRAFADRGRSRSPQEDAFDAMAWRPMVRGEKARVLSCGLPAAIGARPSPNRPTTERRHSPSRENRPTHRCTTHHSCLMTSAVNVFATATPCCAPVPVPPCSSQSRAHRNDRSRYNGLEVGSALVFKAFVRRFIQKGSECLLIPISDVVAGHSVAKGCPRAEGLACRDCAGESCIFDRTCNPRIELAKRIGKKGRRSFKSHGD